VEEWDTLQGKLKIMTIEELPWPWEVVMMESGLEKAARKAAPWA
jgi:hypothetical protein